MSIGRLRRQLDIGLINRLKAGVKHKIVPAKKKKAAPRSAATYRGNRRNAAKDRQHEAVLARRERRSSGFLEQEAAQ